MTEKTVVTVSQANALGILFKDFKNDGKGLFDFVVKGTLKSVVALKALHDMEPYTIIRAYDVGYEGVDSAEQRVANRINAWQEELEAYPPALRQRREPVTLAEKIQAVHWVLETLKIELPKPYKGVEF